MDCDAELLVNGSLMRRVLQSCRLCLVVQRRKVSLETGWYLRSEREPVVIACRDGSQWLWGLCGWR